MSPKQIARVCQNRLTRMAHIDKVGELRGFRQMGAMEGYGEGWSLLVDDSAGNTFRVAVTLYKLAEG